MVHKMSHLMFLHNNTFFNQIGTELSVPESCLSLTSENNLKCVIYFQAAPTYILQCRNGEVFATGNLSYTDPMLNSYKLSFIHIFLSR